MMINIASKRENDSMKITKNNYLISLLFLLFLAPVLNSCSDTNIQSQSPASPTEIRDNKPVIYTNNYPLKYFGDRIYSRKLFFDLLKLSNFGKRIVRFRSPNSDYCRD